MGKDIIDGPFHPSFRELVEGSLICENIQNQIEKDDNIILEINSKDLSKLYANKKVYFNKLKENHNGQINVTINDKLKIGKIKLIVVKKIEDIII